MPSSESKSSSDADLDEKKPAGGSEAKEALTLKKPASTAADAKDSKDADESGGDGGADIVSKVIAFFFDDDEFAQTFERFAETHCHDFDLDMEEMKLEYTDVYNQFLELFEAKLKGTRSFSYFLICCGVAYNSLVTFARLDNSLYRLAGLNGEGVLPPGALRVQERPSVEHRAVLGDPGGHSGF